MSRYRDIAIRYNALESFTYTYSNNFSPGSQKTKNQTNLFVFSVICDSTAEISTVIVISICAVGAWPRMSL